MSEYLDLRYDQACFKASHNSYARDEIPVVDQLKWNPRKTYEAGCRGLELDIQQSARNWSWSISHMDGYCGDAHVQFGTYLELLADWSNRNRKHDVITVTVDIKSTKFDDLEFPYFFDAYVARHFPAERIFRPGDLMKPGKSLTDSVKAGWPKLLDLQGQFIFCLSGDDGRKSLYAQTAPTQRLFFADKDGGMSSATTVGDGYRVFFNFKLTESYFEGSKHDDVPSAAQTTKLVGSIQRLRAHGGLIIRGYDLNSERGWENARTLRVNMMSTDKVCSHSWATVGEMPFVAI